jgi:nucleoside-diphosphate-sugar epimerase
MSRTILIAGCGDLGSSLGVQLAGEGHSVYGLRRRAEPLPPPLKTLQADLADPATLNQLPQEIDTVYYLATPSGFEDAAYRAAYVEGLRNLLAALARQPQPIGRLIFVSSTTVYGQLEGEWVDETSPTEPNGFSGRRMLEAEQLARASGLDAVIVRFGGIYGPGRERMLRKVRAGEPCPADPPLYTNRIHRDDCVAALAHLGQPSVAPGIYVAVDDAPCSQCELMDWLATRMQLPPPPRTSQQGAGGLRGSNKRCRNEKLKASGFRFRYPTYREGYAALLEAD